MQQGGWDSHVHVFNASKQVNNGHYKPADWILADLSALGAPIGINRFVLVQPSVYGSDNSVMLNALRETRGQHRGVAVIDSNTTYDQLVEMDQLGVRGVRFNLVSPVGNDSSLIPSIAPWLRKLGWHIQWYAKADQLQQILQIHAKNGLPCVLDHMGGITVDMKPSDPSWAVLRQLAVMGAWVKLSGWYRLGDLSKDFVPSGPNILQMIDLFGEHAIWGSDSPNTSFDRADMPSYASLIKAVASVAKVDMKAQLKNAEILYR